MRIQLDPDPEPNAGFFVTQKMFTDFFTKYLFPCFSCISFAKEVTPSKEMKMLAKCFFFKLHIVITCKAGQM